uniref:Uncharacterized protein n=1 Tax=Aegilops tauschii subsp. strangulata TaxID=200361 RepID=A0A453GYP5_AEGTS
MSSKMHGLLSWMEGVPQEHAGCANSAFYFNYPNYRNLFPIMALGEFRRRLVANKN